ncbi:MAG: respiratory nitrate reductase subunit gamma [archaeon]|nr:respiratory nitrate reductase subunit gamma [archaeon]MCP8315135.1 respiratory nitrate reductase subunit gamma [archaeon]MCP8316173.1 respiratory nitrate reductase subunit gamma [archaeon]MCP8319760.1 respiratory nitrate reductase subunit gamma [archaeon]
MPAEDAFYIIVMGIMPYIAATIFTGGLIYRIAIWLKSGQKSQLANPKKSSIIERIINLFKGLILEIFFLRKVYKGSRKLWLVTWPTHIAILGMLIGHSRLVAELTPIWNAFNMTQEDIEFFSGLSGSIVGVIMITGLTILLLRRMVVKEVRAISVLDDYVLLVLLLIIGIFGMTMRLIPEAHVLISEEIRPYFVNMLAFNPWPFIASASNPYFAMHLLIVEIFMIYFPFSKLIHVINITVSAVIKGISK